MTELHRRLLEAQDEWTVIVETDEDGIQVFHFDSQKYATNFANSLDENSNYICGIVRKPFYILHLESKLNQEVE